MPWPNSASRSNASNTKNSRWCSHEIHRGVHRNRSRHRRRHRGRARIRPAARLTGASTAEIRAAAARCRRGGPGHLWSQSGRPGPRHAMVSVHQHIAEPGDIRPPDIVVAFTERQREPLGSLSEDDEAVLHRVVKERFVAKQRLIGRPGHLDDASATVSHILQCGLVVRLHKAVVRTTRFPDRGTDCGLR